MKYNELWQTDFTYLPDLAGSLLCIPPYELTEKIREWMDYHNHYRYHEAIAKLTTADRYYERDQMILKRREKVRRKTMKMKTNLNRLVALESLPSEVS
jgi:hypothetical protein